jgi:gluconate 2-dehydrogenase gamma chain
MAFGRAALRRATRFDTGEREENLMTKHDKARRAFLVGTAVGAGAVAGAALVPEGLAQAQQQTTGAAQAPAAHAHSAGGGSGLGAFFNTDDAATVGAFTERLMPGAPGKPGARDAGVLNYIDLALAGAYADQREFYRRGIAQLDAYCQATHKEPFAKLSAAQQDEVITALEQGKATGFGWPSAQAFFNTLRTHTIEGMFADPVYGGNKDFAGWRLVGFPGAHPAFTPADMASKEAFTGGVLIGLQAQAPTKRS